MSGEHKLFTRAIKDLNALFAALGEPPCPIDLPSLKDPSSSRLILDQKTIREFGGCWSRLSNRVAQIAPEMSIFSSLNIPEFLSLLRAGISRRLTRLFIDSAPRLESMKLDNNSDREKVALNTSNIEFTVQVSAKHSSDYYITFYIA